MRTRKPVSFSPENPAEIERIASLIRQNSEASMIILYGRYAGGFPIDPRGGYEFLAVVPYSSQIRTQYIFKHININFPVKNRKERELALHVISESAMKEAVSDNYFYHAVRYEGIVVYQKDGFRLPPRWKFDSHTAYHLLRMEVEKCLKAARNSLEYVGKNIEKCTTEYVHWNLFDALQQLFSALDLAATGISQQNRSELNRLFHSVCRYSDRLEDELDVSNWQNRELFHSFRQFHPGMPVETSECPVHTLKKYYKKIGIVEEIIREGCHKIMGMRQNAKYLNRVDYLKNRMSRSICRPL